MAIEPRERDERPDFSEFGSPEEVADRLQEQRGEIQPFLEAVADGTVSVDYANEVFTELAARSTIDARTGLRNETALLGSKGNRGELGELARQSERAYLREVDGLPPDEVGEAKGKQFAIVVVDLRDFKSINQRFGQPEGNRVLEAVGPAMGKGMRPENHAYRLGGGADEFAILMPDVDSPELVDQILEELEKHMPEHPVTGGRVRFNPDKRGIEIYDTRQNGPDEVHRLFEKALAAVRDDDTPEA